MYWAGGRLTVETSSLLNLPGILGFHHTGWQPTTVDSMLCSQRRAPNSSPKLCRGKSGTFRETPELSPLNRLERQDRELPARS